MYSLFKNLTSYCDVKIYLLCLVDSSLRTVTWSTLHHGLRSPSPPWYWCLYWPGSGCSSSISAASESSNRPKVTRPQMLLGVNVTLRMIGSFSHEELLYINWQIIKCTLWFPSAAACGGRGVAGRSRRRRSERRTKWSGTSIGVWDQWVMQRPASWHSSPSWWCCGSHETRASWTAGPPTSSTPRQSEYQKHWHSLYCSSVSVSLHWMIL